MNDYLLLTAGFLSVFGIIAVSSVIYLLYKGNSRILYALPHPKMRSHWHLVLVAIAVISILTCMYQGALFATSWLAELYASPGARLSQAVALCFTGTTGFMLIAFMAENLVWRTEMDFSEEKVRVLEDTIDVLLHKERKELIQQQLDATITKIRSETFQPDRLERNDDKHQLESRRMAFYSRLAAKLSSS